MAFPPDQREDVTLNGYFHCRGKKLKLSFSNQTITWEKEASPESLFVLPLNQLIAVHPCDCIPSLKPRQAKCHHCMLLQYHLTQSLINVLPFHAKAMRLHYAVPHNKHSWKLESLVFYPAENTVLKAWLCTLQNELSDLKRVKRLLIFVNPFCGKKKGVKIYEKKVAPLLHLAGINAHVIVTQRANHAKEIIEDINIHMFDGIVSVGGDGIFSEILNSVVLKTQKEKNIDVNDQNILARPQLPIGIIPAGSTNTAAHCAMGTENPISATLLIIMGDTIGIDACSVHHRNQFVRFAATFLSYGYFGDVVLESEKLRCLGPTRYDFSGLKTLLNRKLYSGELNLKVTPVSDRSAWDADICNVGCPVCSKASEKVQRGDFITSPSSPEKIKWITVHCRFMALSAAIMSCSCKKSKDGMSPTQHLGNGYCDLIIVSANSRLDYLKYLCRTAYNFKSAFDLSFVQVYRVKEFMFNPFMEDLKTPQVGCVGGTQDNWQQVNSGVWNCDGEVMSEPSVSAKMHCQLVKIFGKGPNRKSERSTCSDCFGFCVKQQD